MRKREVRIEIVAEGDSDQSWWSLVEEALAFMEDHIPNECVYGKFLSDELNARGENRWGIKFKNDADVG